MVEDSTVCLHGKYTSLDRRVVAAVSDDEQRFPYGDELGERLFKYEAADLVEEGLKG